MRLKIVGSHPRAQGSECVIFGYASRSAGAFAAVGARERSDEFTAFGAWEVKPMRPGFGLETAPALFACELAECRTTGRLLVLSHSWSGRLQVNDVARKYTVDLFSDETRLVLLDIVREIMVDVTGLARVEDGSIRLPALTPEALLRHIGERGAWFRFVEPDEDFEPGLARRALGRLRRRPDDGFRLRVVAQLLPHLMGAPPAAAAPDARLRDEMGLLCAAVEGLALRALAGA